MKIIQHGHAYNIEYVTFESSSVLASKEITIEVDHEERVVRGDTIAYGSWFDLDGEEVYKHTLELVQNKVLPKRVLKYYFGEKTCECGNNCDYDDYFELFFCEIDEKL